MLRELLDEELLTHDHLVDRLLEELWEARHVDALLLRVEVDEAIDRCCDERLGVAVSHSHRLLNAGDAGTGETDPHLGRGGLEILAEPGAFDHVGNASSRRMSYVDIPST